MRSPDGALSAFTRVCDARWRSGVHSATQDRPALRLRFMRATTLTVFARGGADFAQRLSRSQTKGRHMRKWISVAVVRALLTVGIFMLTALGSASAQLGPS